MKLKRSKDSLQVRRKTLRLLMSDSTRLISFSKFLPHNYGLWQVDHIRPCNSFDFQIKQHQFVAFNWRNLQPLWSEDNMRKGDNYNPIDETEWVERMLSLGYEGELFLKYEEGNSY